MNSFSHQCRRKGTKIVFVFLCLIGLFLFTKPGLGNESITLRADQWCPYNCDPKSDKPGYMIEVAKSIFEPQGYQIDYATTNWPRAISEARKGVFTGIVGASKSDAPDFIYPDVPLGVNKSCFYVKKDNLWTYKGTPSLSTVTLGVIRDYTYGEPLDSYIKDNTKNSQKIDVVGGDKPLDTNIKKLLVGRIGAIIENHFVMIYKASQAPEASQNIKQVGCIEPDDLFIGFSPAQKNSKKYARLISEGLKAMRNNGKLKEILIKYGLSDWSTH